MSQIVRIICSTVKNNIAKKNYLQSGHVVPPSEVYFIHKPSTFCPSDIAQESRYTAIIKEALSFIDEREVFWVQHDAKRTKSMRVAEAGK